jgi:hypothetical protein
MVSRDLGKPLLRSGGWLRGRGGALWGVGALGVVLGALGALGCGGPVAVVPAAPAGAASAVVVAAPPGLGDGRVGEFVSARFGLKLALPDGKSWRIDDHGGNWLVATHAGAASELVVRTWREEAVMNRGRCEERARFWRKFPERESADIVEKRSVNVPPDFDTVVEVGVIASALEGKKAKPGEALRGFALAFGGKGRRCFAWIYTTSAGGPRAEAVLGERLATMVQSSLGATTVVSELEPQIERAPAP